LVAFTTANASEVTFAQYSQTNVAEQQWTITGSGAGTTVSVLNRNVQFTFGGVPGVPFSGAEDAIFNLTANSTQIGNCAVNCGPNDAYTELGFTGFFSFTDNGGGAAQGRNLLSGTFSVGANPSSSGAQLGSNIGGFAASVRDSSDPAAPLQLVLTSDFLNFANQTDETASFSLSSLIPDFAVGTVTNAQAYPSGSFNAAGTGTFSSNPGPVSSSAPEPLSLALIGGGLIALAMFRRGSNSAASRL
jgi:hypothetical protein